MFKTGDKILHNLHGVGVIERVEEIEVLGRSRQYFIVHITQSNMKVSVPVENCEEVGLRRILNADVLKKVFDVLQGPEIQEAPEKWNQRNKVNIDRLKSGNVLDTAILLKSLSAKDRKKALSVGEKSMLENLRQNLAGEIAIAKKISVEKATVMMDSYIH